MADVTWLAPLPWRRRNRRPPPAGGLLFVPPSAIAVPPEQLPDIPAADLAPLDAECAP